MARGQPVFAINREKALIRKPATLANVSVVLENFLEELVAPILYPTSMNFRVSLPIGKILAENASPMKMVSPFLSCKALSACSPVVFPMFFVDLFLVSPVISLRVEQRISPFGKSSF
jgi:hypothetical protein